MMYRHNTIMHLYLLFELTCGVTDARTRTRTQANEFQAQRPIMGGAGGAGFEEAFAAGGQAAAAGPNWAAEFQQGAGGGAAVMAAGPRAAQARGGMGEFTLHLL